MRKQERRILYASIITGLALLLTVFFYLDFYFYKKYVSVETGSVVAIVNHKKIYEKDVLPRLNYMSALQNTVITLDNVDPEILKAVILEAYFDEVILHKYYQQPFNKKKIDMLVDDYKKKIIREEYLSKYVLSKLTETDFIKKYNGLIEEIKNREERQISLILVASEAEAEKIRSKIKNGRNFADQARKYSIDKASAEHDGNLGYLLKEEISVPQLAAIAFLLKKGEMSKPIQTEEGWNLVMVNDIRLIEPRSFEDVKDIIKDMVEDEAFNKYMRQIINAYEPKIIYNRKL